MTMSFLEIDRLLFASLRRLGINASGHVYTDGSIQDKLDKVLDRDPDNVHALDASLIISIRRHYQESFPLLLRDIPDKADEPERTYPLYLTLKAAAAEITGDIEGAVNTYSELLQLEPSNKWASVCRAKLRNRSML
jgi:hypothetical protein